MTAVSLLKMSDPLRVTLKDSGNQDHRLKLRIRSKHRRAMYCGLPRPWIKCYEGHPNLRRLVKSYSARRKSSA